MERDENVQEYFSLSRKYLQAAEGNLRDELYEPALSNAIHSLELAIKALLHLQIEEPIKTHNVGGLLGKHFRAELGDAVCRKVNRILMVYNIPRYPGIDAPIEEEVIEDIDFIVDLIRNKMAKMISER